MRVRTITTVVVCLVAVLIASTAWAQSEIAPGETLPLAAASFETLKMPALLWASGVAADQLTTYQFSSRYGDLLHEMNPLVRGLNRHPALLVTAGTALDAATAWAAYHFLAGRHPRLLKIAFYGAAVYRSYLAVHNVDMMREAQAIHAAGVSSLVPH
jgi:hypothetical protein